MVTRRYWPQMGDDAACRLATLAAGLRRRGARPHIVAARYAASWPKDLSVRETPVHRPAPAPRSEWSMPRYTRALTNWLREQAPAFDLLYADAMREEGAMVVEVARRAGVPSVLRYAGVGDCSDDAWWATSRAAKRCMGVCLKADAVIATRASAEQTLLSAGLSRSRIHRIDDGFVPGPPNDPAARAAARKALANVNSDLFVPVDGKVLLTTNRMVAEGGLGDLVKVLPELLERHPQLRVWLTNDGELRDDFFEYLRGCGVRSLVSMPGSFGAVDELLLASDLYVLPRDTDGLEYYFPRIVGAGIPAAVVDTVETRRLLAESFSQAVSFPPDHPAAIRDALETLLSDYPQSQKTARHIRQTALQHSFGESVEQHLRLFCRLTGKTLTGNSMTAEPLL
ncbi:Glycosyl transferases group 1 [Roseimaritima ulvae]|uniref:Glycosyl transferases group 1 n=2 Tax=Roseimaritima ulvae TaxID=980254 RepID=A0A5B9QQI9_9BACT|nr:Glycosyl transferases group 1 [Roseimaritima ulvae]